MKNINILFVQFHEKIGGGERYLINVIEALPAEYNVFLLTPNNSCELKNNIKRNFLSLSYRFKRTIGPFPRFSLGLNLFLRKVIKENNIDIVHVNEGYILPSFYLLKTKLVFTSHGRWDTYFWISRFILKTLNPITLSSTSTQLKRLESLVDNVNLMPFFNLFDPIKLKKFKENNFDLGIVARFSTVKNHKLAFQIARSSKKILHIYGGRTLATIDEPSSYEEELISIINKDVNLIHHGFESDLDKIYKKIDILLITSDQESFGMVAIEALSYGIPILSTLTEGSVDIINQGKNGFICKDIDDFCVKIDRVSKNYSFFSENAHKSAKKYIKDEYINRLKEIYKN